MKQLQLQEINIPVETGTRKEVKVSEKFGQNQEHVKVLELFWICDQCKYRHSHRIRYKSVYTANDMLRVATASFNLSFYACDCAETRNVKKEGKESAKPGVVR